jgi:hypothetical protein
MKLDVVKVVSVVRPQIACAVVPTAMTYEDSQGQLNTIKYTVAGDCRKTWRLTRLPPVQTRELTPLSPYTIRISIRDV